MSAILTFRTIIPFILFLSIQVSSSSQELVNERAQWFVDARFGMFIHWGIYSGAEGIWKGEKTRDNIDYAEWIQYRNRIDKQEYLTLLDRFKWNEIDPEEWVLLAKKSGMKYVIITAKHHDGFALWDSKSSDYDVAGFTNPKRDIIKELSDACQKHGLKLGLYYSHWVDWEHPYGWDHTKELTGISPENYNRYWQEKVIPQMKELLTNYGPIGIIWFDMWIHHSETIVTKEQLLQLKGLIRELQPECLVNSRLGLSITEDSDVDFQELGDNQIGSNKENFPWQSPATVALSWGYHILDTDWKSTTTLLQSVINNVSLNGNFLLNIGPKANGDVPFEITQRLLEIGEWLKINGESVYGSGAFDLPKEQHDWGKITCKKTASGTNLYFHIFNWPLNNKLNITGITTKPDKLYLLADKQKSPLQFEYNKVITTIDLPASQPDPYVTVIVAEYSNYPDIIEKLVSKTMDGGYSLTPSNLFVAPENMKIESRSRRGTIPPHVALKEKSVFLWKIYIDEPGTKKIDISYSFEGKKAKSSISLKAAKKTFSHLVMPTGKTIGEPNSNWAIDNFKSNNLGTIDFMEPGFYEIALEIIPVTDEVIKFQWLWIK